MLLPRNWEALGGAEGPASDAAGPEGRAVGQQVSDAMRFGPPPAGSGRVLQSDGAGGVTSQALPGMTGNQYR